MTNTALLDQKIKESGMTVVAIADKLGIDRVTFYNRKNNKINSEFTASDIVKLTEILHLTKSERDRIFFSKG